MTLWQYLKERIKPYKDRVAFANSNLTYADILAFEKGLEIGDDDLDVAMPAQLTIINTNSEQNISHVHITIQEGKFHQVKRMFQAIGKRVTYLKRIAFGPLLLPESLQLGEYRPLTADEIEMLQKF